MASPLIAVALHTKILVMTYSEQNIVKLLLIIFSFSLFLIRLC